MNNSNFKQLKISKTWEFINPLYSENHELIMSAIIRDMDENPVAIIELEHSSEGVSYSYVEYTIYPVAKFLDKWYQIGKAALHVLIDKTNFRAFHMDKVPSFQESVAYSSTIVDGFLMGVTPGYDGSSRVEVRNNAGDDLLFCINYNAGYIDSYPYTSIIFGDCYYADSSKKCCREELHLNFYKQKITPKDGRIKISGMLIHDNDAKIEKKLLIKIKEIKATE